MVRHSLNEEQEREAKLLEAKIRLAVDQEISALARLEAMCFRRLAVADVSIIIIGRLSPRLA